MPPRSRTTEHRYQRATVERLVVQGYTPVVNLASKEDPSGLADFGAVNVDIQKVDPSLGINLVHQVPNFVNSDICNLPFADKTFRLAVMGEVWEHLRFDKAVQAVSEAKRVLQDDGKIVVTFPLDPRPPEVQHDPPVYTEFVDGCTAYHQTVWTDELLNKLYAAVGIKETHRDHLTYLLGGVPLGGRGLILEKA